MTHEVSGFELIALDRLTEVSQRLPFDPEIMAGLERKGLITRLAGEWALTRCGRSTVAHVMGDGRSAD